MDKIQEYERQKAEIERTAADSEEYARRIKELVERLGI